MPKKKKKELTGWISLHPRDSQEFSPTPQFKNISSSALRFLYGPTLTSTHDHWKNHSLDYKDKCNVFDICLTNVMSAK